MKLPLQSVALTTKGASCSKHSEGQQCQHANEDKAAPQGLRAINVKMKETEGRH